LAWGLRSKAGDQDLLLANRRSQYRIGRNKKRANGRNQIVRRLTGVVALCLLSFPALCQSTSKYQVATIIDVKAHQAVGDARSDAASYDVSAKVGDTIYVVLYTPPLGELPPKYEAGREMLVLVGKNTITYNDMLGHSLQVPIQSRRAVAEPKASK
jgi:hypothetical protein